jgi:hypothetical protein
MQITTIQRHGALLCNQHHTLQRLVLEINNKVRIVGILTEAQRGAIDEATHQLSDSGDMLSHSLASVAVWRTWAGSSKDGITAVVAESTEDNEAYIDADPDVLPHQLVRILSRDFCVYLQRHRELLDYTFSNEEIETIGRKHKALYDSYHRQLDVKSSIDSFDDGASYRDAWVGLQNTYPSLERFVGGLATIFPGTSTVESDFSVVKYEKNKNRMSLTDASLYGILHAKQYRRMHSLKVYFYSEYCLNKHCRIAPNLAFTLRRI